MMFRNTTRVIVVLAVTTALAQGPSPATVAGGTQIMSQRNGLGGRSGVFSWTENKTAGAQTPATLRQPLQDMKNRLAQMHLVLKRMQARAAKSTAKDSLAKANLEMWQLMVGHLDKQFQELNVATAAREDMLARRAAMYRQADAKAQATAQTARSAAQPPTTTPASAAHAAGQSTAGQIPASQTPPPPPAPAFPSPN